MFSKNKQILARLDELQSLIKQPRGIAGAVDAFFEAEEALGMEGLMDFCSADPATFAILARPAQGPQYTEKKWALRSANIPALEKSIRTFLASADKRTSYAVVPLVWIPSEMKSRGYVEFTTWGTGLLMTPPEHPLFIPYSAEKFAADLVITIRGSYEYGRQPVAVLAFPHEDLQTYFSANTFHRLKDNARVPSGNILGVLGKPTDEEKQLLTGIIRGYWSRLAKLGYQNKDNLFKDPIPETLTCGHPGLPQKVGIAGEWGAQGTLEGWHRLEKINRLISEHKANAETLMAGAR